MKFVGGARVGGGGAAGTAGAMGAAGGIGVADAAGAMGAAGSPIALVTPPAHAAASSVASTLPKELVLIAIRGLSLVRGRIAPPAPGPPGVLGEPAGRSKVSTCDYMRSDLNPARSSSTNSSGCSQAAKCPPLSSLL